MAHDTRREQQFEAEKKHPREETAQFDAVTARLHAERRRIEARTTSPSRKIFWFLVLAASGLMIAVAGMSSLFILTISRLF